MDGGITVFRYALKYNYSMMDMKLFQQRFKNKAYDCPLKINLYVSIYTLEY